ncbi:myozenin-3 [Anguilla anguilla]|uniref:myozenin-3 n=1 Tax=Anguilla anguilla TaxID=7936 RepID=UPI0015B304EA|nr:myozenin-3 [Anguilla anguilla]
MIHLTYRDRAKNRQLQAVEMNGDLQEVHLDLGRKISVPKDVMMEELELKANRASLMYHERQKRANRFTLENAGSSSKPGGHTGQAGETAQGQSHTDGMQDGKHNFQADNFQSDNFQMKNFSGPGGKTGMLASLQQSMAKKGSPDVLAPGYSGPLKEVPHERFNVTVIPKSYHCPWQKSWSDRENIVTTVNIQLPEAPRKVTYKCFNRAPTPFGGNMRTPGFQLMEVHEESNPAWNRMCHRPDFNRAPQGWGESPEL